MMKGNVITDIYNTLKIDLFIYPYMVLQVVRNVLMGLTIYQASGRCNDDLFIILKII